jgi:hypothetical protein
LNPLINLRQMQKDVIWRGLQSKSLLNQQIGVRQQYLFDKT